MNESVPLQAARRAEAADSSFEEVYFEVQAEIDLTKHPGGLDATEELIALCRIDAADHVLDVGCGVGMTPAYLAKEVGCRVTGLDLRGSMILRAVERAGRAGLRDRAHFVVGDIRHLPFRADAFDVVMAESVLTLIAEQDRAMGECVRVAKVGGAVGMAETNWRREPPAGFMERLSDGFGRMIFVLSPEEWHALLARAGLHDIVARNHAMSLGSEFRGRLRRLGLGQLLRIWRKFFALAWTEPKYSRFVKEALSEPLELLRYWGYGVYVGWK
jgi:SAM-dependent methyltransferase